MRRGNMLVATLIACAILSIILLVGLAVLSMEQEVGQKRVSYLQLEQLHRTSVAEALSRLNQTHQRVAENTVLVDDMPIQGQHRKVVVSSVKEQLVAIQTESHIKGGGRRTHHVQLWCLGADARFAIQPQKISLCTGRGLSRMDNDWLKAHATRDIVVCNNGTEPISLGSGGAFDTPLDGGLFVGQVANRPFKTTIQSPLKCAETVLLKSDVYVARALCAKRIFIDGTLHLAEGATVEAEEIFLRQEASIDTLRRLRGKVYMPISTVSAEDMEQLPEEDQSIYSAIQPLPKFDEAVTEYYYFMNQQID